MEYLKVDPRFDEHPDVEAAGFWAGGLFQFVLRLSARLDLQGRLDEKRANPAWLARKWNLTSEATGGVDPASIVSSALDACVLHGLLRPTGDGELAISKWDEWYQPHKTGAQRQADYAARRKSTGRRKLTPSDASDAGADGSDALASANVTSVIDDATDKTDATPHHTTPLHKEEAVADAPALLGDSWNELTSEPLPRVTELKGPRRKAAARALKRRPLEQWRSVFTRINASPFCRGEKGAWRADFDWAIRPGGAKPEPALKVLEGSYDDAPEKPAQRPAPREPLDTRPRSACTVQACKGGSEASLAGVDLCYWHLSEAQRALLDFRDTPGVTAWAAAQEARP